MRIFQFLYLATLLLFIENFSLAADIYPLADIKPGMKGTWKTVISGTKLETFELEVLGIAENFAGPKRAVIICQAVDPINLRSGPVAGMSGSPVYFDGKIAGAYAYGFTWSRDQAIIGVTPIEQMLEIFDDYPYNDKKKSLADIDKEKSISTNYTEVGLSNIQNSGNYSSIYLNNFSAIRNRKTFNLSQNTNNWKITTGAVSIGNSELISLLKSLPTPVLLSGISNDTVKFLKPKFRKLGIEILNAPVGRSSAEKNYLLDPGYPVSGVLMTGDFMAAGTGTITYREKDKILGFGHPFFQSGKSNMPMAGSEIITVVRTMPMSFKLPSIGPIIGEIYQDRLTAIAGKIGEIPVMTKLHINKKLPDNKIKKYSGEIYKHPIMLPLLAMSALSESLHVTMESATEQTYYLKGEILIDGFEPLTFEDIGGGPAGSWELSNRFFENCILLTANQFERAQIRKIDLSIELQENWRISGIKSVYLKNNRVLPGENINLTIDFFNYLDEVTGKDISIPLPATVRHLDELTVFIGDAESADKIDGNNNLQVTSLKELIDQWRKRRSWKTVTVKLLQKSKGIRIEGSELANLPPSVLYRYASPLNMVAKSGITEKTIWETKIELPSEFHGNYRLPITIE